MHEVIEVGDSDAQKTTCTFEWRKEATELTTNQQQYLWFFIDAFRSFQTFVKIIEIVKMAPEVQKNGRVWSRGLIVLKFGIS